MKRIPAHTLIMAMGVAAGNYPAGQLTISPDERRRRRKKKKLAAKSKRRNRR